LYNGLKMLACSKNEPKKGNSAKSIRVTLSIFNAMGCALLSFAVSAPAEPCADIADLKYPNAVISVAEAFRGGAFTPEGQKSIEDLPEFCRVAAVLRPSSDSDIRVEVWMPRANWNGRLEGTGNGGFAGSIVYKSLADGVRHGYAVVNTDMGMSVPSGSDPSIFANRPERWTDWGWRSTHEMTLLAKLVVKAYYGRDANKSYFEGCSTGGEQGLAEAQRFPEDYDGIVAGAVANNRTGVHLSILWNFAALQRTPDAYIPQSKLSALQNAVLAACGGDRALRQGFLDDLQTCRFDPATLLCAGADGDNCLTGPQVETARSLYAGPTNPRTHEILYSGMAAGSEYAWDKVDPDPAPGNQPPFAPIFKWVLGPRWDWRVFDWDRQASQYEAALKDHVNATNPNLDGLRRSGHKLLVYHGWADWLVVPGEAIRYYDAVAARYNGSDNGNRRSKASMGEFYRLFMVPGIEHCAGGAGPDDIDPLSAMVDWVEHGIVPASLVATKRGPNGEIVMQRPVCPYPQVAAYTGVGSEADASSYSCATSGNLRTR
jgi:feruloyl esterase